MQPLLRAAVRARDQLVENVVVSLHAGLRDDAALLEQVIDDFAPLDQEVVVQAHFHPFTEARRVVCSAMQWGKGETDQWRTEKGRSEQLGGCESVAKALPMYIR